MSLQLGDYPTGAMIDFKWSTFDQTGASITRSTDGTLKIYKANSVTERSSLAGVTQTEDFDAATGVHHIRIDTSDNTDAGFYVAGGEYQVVMTAMTIDTKVVNAVIAHFSIERSGGVLALIKSRLVGTIATGTHNPQSGDAYARLGAPAGASVSADIAAIEAQTDDIGAAGAGLTAIPWNAAWDAEVQNEVNDALIANGLDDVATLADMANNYPVGTVVSDGSNTSSTFKTNLAEVNDHWNRSFLRFTTGALTGQVSRVSDFVAATDFITVADPFTAAPTAGDTFILVNR